MEAAEHYPLTGWRHDWARISLHLLQLGEDDQGLPGWFVSSCMWIGLEVIDPVIDLSLGRFPSSWKSRWPNRFVDEWHRDRRGGAAPYGETARLRALRKLTWWLPVPRNVKSMMLVQK